MPKDADVPAAGFRIELPIEQAVEGPVLCPRNPCPENDAAFSEWQAPLTWHSVESLMQVSRFYEGRKGLMFALKQRVPDMVWRVGWHLWYDRAIVTRDEAPGDCTITGQFAMEEVTTGYGSDNNVHVNPWAGVVARMQDVRRYYFLCLEYPRAVTLYRREDNCWLVLARHQVHLDVWTAYELKLVLRGSKLDGYLDGRRVLSANDYHYKGGKAGYRVNITSVLLRGAVEAAPPALDAHRQAAARARDEVGRLAGELPKAKLVGRIDLGEPAQVLFGNFASPGRPLQMLAMRPAAESGPTHVLKTLSGQTLWEARVPKFASIIATDPRQDGHCDIFGYSDSEVILLDGRTGKALARRALASLPHGPLRTRFLPAHPVNLSGGPAAREFLLSEGTNQRRGWALNEDLSDRWTVETISGHGHGNHVSCCDVDGDGREEIFAGACLISPDGEIVWRQEEVVARLKCPNGGHVDSSVMGFLSGPDAPPTVHMMGSSAGHMVVDARTGEMIAAHDQGHCQGGSAGRLVPGEPGFQVLSCCRWGNYGLTGVYSGDGRLISRFQVDYEIDSAHPVNWTGDGRELILIAGSPLKAGLYDHLGRRLVPLTEFYPEIRPFPLRNRKGQVECADLFDDPRDVIALRIGATVLLIGPDAPLPAGGPVHRSVFRWGLSRPG